jgi:hypothetical protein
MVKYIYKVFPCVGEWCTKFFLDYDVAIKELEKQCTIQGDQKWGYQVYLECEQKKPDDYVSVPNESDYTSVYLMECNSKRCMIRRGEVNVSQLRFE